MISRRRITLLGILMLLVVALLSSPDSARAAGDTVKVFVLAGQSNMEGKAKNSLLDHQATAEPESNVGGRVGTLCSKHRPIEHGVAQIDRL